MGAEVSSLEVFLERVGCVWRCECLLDSVTDGIGFDESFVVLFVSDSGDELEKDFGLESVVSGVDTFDIGVRFVCVVIGRGVGYKFALDDGVLGMESCEAVDLLG